jgi:hypothetical protein
MDGGVETVLGILILYTFKDDGLLAHGSSNESLHSGKRRRGALANNPKHLVAVLLMPGEVVVVMNPLHNLGAQDLRHTVAHPVTARIGVSAGKVHGKQVLRTQIAVYVQYARLDIQAVLRAGGLEEPSGNPVAKAARSKVDPHPNTVFLIRKDVDVVVA